MKVIKHLIGFLKDFEKYRKSGGIVNLSVSYVNPSERFVGNTVLVTGGSSGIGFAVADMFLKEGAKVIICSRKKETLIEAQNNLGKGVFILQMDISDISAIKSKIEEAHSMVGSIDVFVNCAGVTDYSGKSTNDERLYNYIVDINEKGLYFMCKEEGDYMIKNKIQGKIVNITSKAGERMVFHPYYISKNGANAITRAIARELIKHHINVNAVAPGCVPTNINEWSKNQNMDENAFCFRHASKRFTLAEEIASMVLYLSSGASSNIVGQVINIDGGIYD